jgi:hypothetical protein
MERRDLVLGQERTESGQLRELSPGMRAFCGLERYSGIIELRCAIESGTYRISGHVLAACLMLKMLK